ncbi:hypothetical protein C8R43DRAFT_1138296 [Mycena crocata]|nr:hypothetical protein C8R43DRAFT_1138296 [Mycena crocata]
MAPKHWATEEQRQWIDEKMPEFIRRQAEGKLYLFWPPMQEEFFRRWSQYRELRLPKPNGPGARPLTAGELSRLGDTISEKKRQLENSFRNNSKKYGNAHAPGGSSSVAAVATRRVFMLNVPRRQRAHQPIELFQKRNPEVIRVALSQEGYDQMNEAAMAADVEGWEDEPDDTSQTRIKRTKADRMRLRTRVVRALFDAASEEEHADIAAEIEQEKEQIRQNNSDAEKAREAGLQSTTPQQRQEAVDVLDSAYSELHKGTYAAAGWVGMSIVGGPNPRLGGELSYKVVCFGRTPAGNDFEQACPDFETNIEQTFETWLRAIFSPEQRAACALPVSAPLPSEARLPRLQGSDATTAPSKPKKPKRMVKKSKSKSKSPASDSQASAPTPNLTVDAVVPGAVEAPLSLDANPSAASTTETCDLDLPDTSDSALRLSSDFDTFATTPSASDLQPPSPPAADNADVFTGSDLDLNLRPDGFCGNTSTFDPYSFDEAAFEYDSQSPDLPLQNALKFDDSSSSLSSPPGHETTFDLPPLRSSTPGEEAQRSPPSPTPTLAGPAVPRARPSWKNAPPTASAAPLPTTTASLHAGRSVGGFNFPVETSTSARGIYAPSILFQAFTRPPMPAPTVSPTPTRFGMAKPIGPLPTPPRFVGRTPGPPGPTRAAQTLMAIIGDQHAPIVNAVSANSTTTITDATSADVTTSTTSVPAVPGVAAAPTSTASPAPAPTPIVITGDTGSELCTVFPQSRPPTRAPVPAVARPTAGSAPAKKKTTGPKAVTAAAVKKAAAAKAAEAVKVAEAAEAEVDANDATTAPKRGRGRPRKAGAAEAALAEATNVATTPATGEAPALVYSVTNNSVAFDKVVQGRRAAVAAGKAAQKEKERAAEVEAEARRGWFSTPNPDGPTDTVTLRRTRKAPRMADGSTMTRDWVKSSRVNNPHAATEAALLARTAGAGKRKAAPSENDGPKKKQRTRA